MKVTAAAMVIALQFGAACSNTPGPAPFPANQTAYTVEKQLEAAGCAPDGGLATLEHIHGDVNRAPWVDCLFASDGMVQSCKVPCPLP